SLRSPDILAPAEIPVAAGKKIANAVQKPISGVKAALVLASKVARSNSKSPPTRNETTESISTASTTYWALSATSAPLKVSTNKPVTTIDEMICGTLAATSPCAAAGARSATIVKIASVKPMV